MFIHRLWNEGGANGYAIHSNVVASFLSRNCEDVASYFSPAGVFRLVDRDGGGVLDAASGREAVASLCRRLHENIEVLKAETVDMRLCAEGIRYDWNATVRNWGFGAVRATHGHCRLELAGSSIRVWELALCPDLYFDLINPNAPRGRRLAQS